MCHLFSLLVTCIVSPLCLNYNTRISHAIWLRFLC
uniref:Uncharacterized protein n=1 Tax=Anguilla anguilla TaxID=7936 RepID=A0A0E9RY63_ANGAN